MPRNSESQARGAHNRHHVKKSIAKSSCTLCVAEHPEIAGEVDLAAPENAPEIPEKEDQPNRPTQPVVLLLPAPAKEPLSFDEQMQRDRLYRFAALKRSVEEVSTALGLDVKAFEDIVMASFCVSWAALSDRASIEMELEVLSNIYLRAQGNDPRFVLLYTKLQNTPGFTEQIGNSRMLLPASVVTDLRNMSVEQLLLRRQELAKVFDRPGRFDQAGQLTSTCCLVDTLEGERPAPIKYVPPIIPGTDEDLKRKAMILLGPTKKVVEEVPMEVVPIPQAQPTPTTTHGPVIARPSAGMLHVR